MKVPYAVAKEMKNFAYLANVRASDALKAIPGLNSGPYGLTPDDVKNTPEYKKAWSDFNLSFEQMRRTNAWFNKTYKKEYAAERREWVAQQEAFSNQIIKGE